MDYTKLFYWLSVADNAKVFFAWGIFIFMLILIISTAVHMAIVSSSESSKDEKDVDSRIRRVTRSWQFTGLFWSMVFWSLYIFTPSKKDALLIVAGGQTLNYLTTDTITKQIPREMSNFVLTELKNMAKDAEVDLNISNRKEQILNDIKEMTTEELIHKMKDNPELKELILN
jgi:hypothetical protein